MEDVKEGVAKSIYLLGRVEKRVESRRQLFNKDRRCSLQSLFSRLKHPDRKGISIFDLNAFVDDLGMRVPKEEFELLFFHLDKDKDQELSLEELKAMVRPAESTYSEAGFTAGGLTPEETRLFGKVIAEELDGWLLFEDAKYRLIQKEAFNLHGVFGAICQADKSQFDVRDLYEFMKKHVTLEEVTMLKAERAFRRLDLNSNGFITLAEWELIFVPFLLRKIQRYPSFKNRSEYVSVLEHKYPQSLRSPPRGFSGIIQLSKKRSSRAGEPTR